MCDINYPFVCQINYLDRSRLGPSSSLRFKWRRYNGKRGKEIFEQKWCFMYANKKSFDIRIVLSHFRSRIKSRFLFVFFLAFSTVLWFHTKVAFIATELKFSSNGISLRMRFEFRAENCMARKKFKLNNIYQNSNATSCWWRADANRIFIMCRKKNISKSVFLAPQQRCLQKTQEKSLHLVFLLLMSLRFAVISKVEFLL